MTEQCILRLEQALVEAVDDERWDDIRTIDAEISKLLSAIHAAGEQHLYREQLEPLRRTHQRVAKICGEQRDLLALKIQQHQQQREGQQAYALFTSDNEDQS